jgi:uroporphyrinogen-III decarboxylase
MIRTPVGDVWQTLQPDTTGYEGNTWIIEHFIKEPEDYRVMEYYIRDAVFHDNYETLRELIRRVGGDGLVYVRVAKSPIQEILYQMMGIERFSLHLYDHPDLIDSLHAVMLERYEELFELAAGSPVEILLLGDNITSDMVSPDRYEKYLMPIYARAKHHISGTDKKLAVHMDGHLSTLKDLIAQSQIDIIEAFTPPPMGDLSLEQARAIWPGKALWINFTSSMHIASPESIASHTRQLLREAGDARGFAIGVTEDAPPEALEHSLETISRVIRDNDQN